MIQDFCKRGKSLIVMSNVINNVFYLFAFFMSLIRCFFAIVASATIASQMLADLRGLKELHTYYLVPAAVLICVCLWHLIRICLCFLFRASPISFRVRLSLAYRFVLLFALSLSPFFSRLFPLCGSLDYRSGGSPFPSLSRPRKHVPRSLH